MYAPLTSPKASLRYHWNYICWTDLFSFLAWIATPPQGRTSAISGFFEAKAKKLTVVDLFFVLFKSPFFSFLPFLPGTTKRMYQDNNYSSGYSANQLHSPPPSRSNWDDRNAAATTEIPLQDTSGSPHVKFAPKSPSIIPSPVYNSPSVISSSMPMHTPVTTNDPAGTPRSRNFGTDTFAASSDKTAVESEHDGMAYDMYNKRGGEETGTSYYGNAKTSLRSDGFMRLESTDDDVAPEGYNNTRGYPQAPPPPPPAAGPPQGSAYPPFLQSAPMMMHPAAGNRSLPMRLLLGPYRVPWFSYLSALAMLIIMVMELVKNNQLTGSVISTSPYFNPLIGPSSTVKTEIEVVAQKEKTL